MIQATRRTPQSIARLRERIERTDDALLSLLLRRATLARQVGRAKERAGLPLLDPVREARVVRRAGARARELGMPPEAVRALFWGIIAMCRSEQVRDPQAVASRTSRPTARRGKT